MSRTLILIALLFLACTRASPAPTLPLAATDFCHPTADACSTTAAPETAFAGYRKDFFFPYTQYPEASIPDPVDGGRVQIAARARVGGVVQKVTLNGVDLETLYRPGLLDWYHVWPRQLVAGQPFWLAFHSRDATLDSSTPVTIQVTTDAGVALDEHLTLRTSPVELVSVSFSPAMDSLQIHLKNGASESHAVRSLLVNGRDVTDAACVPTPTLDPGATTLITVPLCAKAAPGDAWTVVIQFVDGSSAVATGRAFRPFFPIETWPSSSDCPFPNEANGNYEEHRQHGIDTFFVHEGYSCPVSSGHEILQSFASTPDAFTLPERSLSIPDGMAPHVAARFCGDEADGELANTLDAQHCSDRFWAENPEIPTYIGGSRSRHNGAFAGTTDIQGMDFYVCACAPHITDFGALPPFRGAYDYAVANRKNHAPLPTWTYTQGFSGAWDVTANTPGAIPNYRQVTPAEMRAEAMSVIAAGAKGLMYFQTKLEQAHAFPESWEELSRVNHDLLAVRDVLATGAATGLASSDEHTIVEAIRGQDAIIVPAVSLSFVTDLAGPEVADTNDVLCGIGMDLHWQWAPHLTDIVVRVPADFSVVGVSEIRNGTITTTPTVLKGRDLTLRNIRFDETAPARLFVLTSSTEAELRIKASLTAH